jgi:hypothetical protein
MLNLYDLPEVAEFLPELESYAQLTSTSVEDCLADAVYNWLKGPARADMLARLAELHCLDAVN